MNLLYRSLAFIFIVFLLPSCEFSCHIGKIKEKTDHVTSPVIKDGAIIYNGIQLASNKIKLSKAYLVLENSEERVPNDNVIDFKSPVKLLLLIDSGWVTQDEKVWLGASEKVVSEKGKTLLDEKDLFVSYTDGVPAEDAKIIGITLTLRVKSGTPTFFTVFFKLWDKKGKGYIEGNYKLFSK